MMQRSILVSVSEGNSIMVSQAMRKLVSIAFVGIIGIIVFF